MSNQKRKYPLHILPAHFEEWVTDSGVNETITTLNLKSMSIPEEIDELLDRNTKNRWASWKHGAGWAVMGVDYITGERIYEGAQFKPDNPVQRCEHGKPKFKKDGSPDLQKYFNVLGEETAPLFLDTGKPGYWLAILNDVGIRLLITEGAKKAGAALTAGEACISIPGVGNGQKLGRLKKDIKAFCQKGRNIVLAFDSDLFHNINVCRELDRLGRLICKEGAVISVLVLPRDTKGLDDYIVAYGYEAFRELVEQAITFEEWRERYIKREIQQVRSPMDFIPDVEENYQIKAQQALFSDRWVSINGELYQWTGTHYQLRSNATVRRRIADWCRSTPVYSSSSDEWRFSYATATHVNNIYSWLVEAFSIDPALVNPPGLNCLNGVLQVTWKGKIPRWDLVKHDPSVIYTHVGEFEFNSDADPTACDRLLECLDPPQRDIFLKTMAASLDLQAIREFKGRAIRALLCKGHGNNGKDSLREAVAILYGVGVVNATVSDFQSYDTGKKFPLSKLEYARISWSSENSSFKQLDDLQSLKAAITGESIDIERKNKDEHPVSLSTVFLFNINNVPNLQASLEAIESRWAVLSFDKTFKTGADPAKGELEADPRFRYDPDFIKREVVPALLNKMLAVLPEVAMNGIDYSCTNGALEEIREEKNHLLRFAREVGLDFRPGAKVYVKDLWELLTKWYIEHGYVAVETNAKGQEKLNFLDSGNPGDRPVKKIGDVPSRFLELFTKAKRDKENGRHPTHANGVYLLNLGIGEGNSTPNGMSRRYAITPAEYLESVGLDNFIASLPVQLLQNLKIKIDNHPSHPSTFSKTSDSSFHSTLPEDFPQASPKEVTASPESSLGESSITESSNVVTSPAVSIGVAGEGDIVAGNFTKNFDSDRSNFKIGDRVAHANPKEKSYNWHGEIVAITPPTAKVKWEERKGMRGGEILSAELSNLRLI